MKRAAAIFAISMGLMMFATWAFLFLSGQYPQVRTIPLETGYLLVAEFLTSAGLVVGGIGMLSRRPWADPLILVALGELIYCTIRFAGELGQEGSLPGLAFFTLVGSTGIVFSVCLVLEAKRPRSKA